jgi:hypothetical protein
MHSVSDDETPIFSKKDIQEIRVAMKKLVDENEELQAKMIAMNQYVKSSEATLKKANKYIEQLEFALASSVTPSQN